jgi:hypothetical protein
MYRKLLASFFALIGFLSFQIPPVEAADIDVTSPEIYYASPREYKIAGIITRIMY